MRLLPVDAPLPEHVGRRIDATDRVVAPGFIDLHSHGGLMILAEPRHEPKVRQGVTTEIVGVDGNGFAPFERREDLLALRRARLRASTAGPDLDYDWRTVADYLARYDGTVSVNVGTLVGNSQLRIGGARLGRRARPTTAALDRMRGILRDAMAEGAVGLSTGPRLPAGQLRHDRGARRAHRGGGRGRRLLPHARPLPARRPLPRPVQGGDRDRAARRRAQPTSPTSITARRIPGGPEALLALVDDARAEGLDVTFDTLPVRVGQHAAADPAPAAGSRRADPGRSRNASPTARPATGSARRFATAARPTRVRPAGRTCASARSAAPTSCAGSR